MSIPKSRGKTLIIDLDGTVFAHGKDGTGAIYEEALKQPRDNNRRYVTKVAYLLDGVREAFNDWHGKGYRLILMTGRCESTRKETEEQLRMHGLFWDMLIMGIGGGQRVLINDWKFDENGHFTAQSVKAVAINVIRDRGFQDINDQYTNAVADILIRQGVENAKLPLEI